MGQKVNAHGNRVGIIKDWDTKWYADKKNFATNLKQDDDIRKFIKKNYYKSAISKITIERAANKVTVNIHTGRPATIIGKQGAMLKKISTEARRDIERFMGTKVYLETWVKVKENWRDNMNYIRSFGYNDQ